MRRTFVRGVIELIFVGAAFTNSFAEQHKIQVTKSPASETPSMNGATLVADYGSFKIYDVPDTAPDVLAARGVALRDEYNVIDLNSGPLDTRTAAVIARRQPVAAFSGKHCHLVQFSGPVTPDWYQALLKTGVKVLSYIPYNAYLVRGDAQALSNLHDWAGSASYVQWEAAYLAEDKIHAHAREQNGPAANDFDHTDLMSVQLAADDEANPATLVLIDQLRTAPILRHNKFMNFVNVIVRIPRSRLTQLASQSDVISIQPYVVPEKMDERQDQIVAGNLSGNVPSGPGYLAWLAGIGFTQTQFSTSDFAVDLTDSGIDNGTNHPFHFGLYVSGDTNGTSRIIYNRLEGTPNGGSTLQGCDGHGTINCHIIAGYDDLSGFPFADASGFHFGLGVCPFAQVGSSVIFDPSNFTFPDYEDLQSRAYRDKARLSSNSWGANTAGAYNSDDQRYDALVRDAQPASSAVPNAGNQEMVIVFAAGNAGSGAQTIGSPGSAKNVFTVGAAENVQAFGGSDGCAVSDTGADSANDIINFSSRGPCADGRKKPDLVAPGTHISGGVAQISNPGSLGTANSCFNSNGVCGGVTSGFFPSGQQFYTASSGTSHSTPAVAGACALLRQFFINNTWTPPSPAMTKAYLMNGARYMTGVGANDTLWSNNQGMGELNLGMAFDGVPRVLRDELDKFTGTGQFRTFTGSISDSNKPFRVTIAWTDAPGATSGNAYNNDLDLTVTVGGNTYKGNVFSGSNSVTGGTADVKNNVESVFIPAGVSGPFTVTVTAANINSDGVPNDADPLDQDFALVVYNGIQTLTPILSPAGFSIIGGNGNGYVDPNECNQLNLLVQNTGSAAATNVQAALATTTPGVTVAFGSAVYPDIAAGATATNAVPFQISTAPSFTCGTPVSLTLTVTYGGGSNTFMYTLPSASATSYAISQTTGVSIVAGTTDIGNHGDDTVTTIALPFGFTFYDQTFSNVTLSSNGNLQFLSSNNAYANSCLPYSSFNYAIAPLWDDLRTDGTGSGIFTSTTGVAPNRIFNIEWRAQYFANNSSVNFEVRLYENAMRFDIVYGTLNGNGSSATVGAQKGTGSAVDQFECNMSGLAAGLQLTYQIACTDGGGACAGAADTDADGLPDSWEISYFGNLSQGPNDDPDGDGMSNLQEYLAGTDPTNSSSALRIKAITQENNDVRVTWTLGSGKTNALQVTTGNGSDFDTNNFADLFTVTNTVGSETNYLDLGGATNSASRYYRVRLVP